MAGMNSPVSWFRENKEHAEAISVLIHFDVERHRRLRFEKGKMFGNLCSTLKKIRQPDLRDCTQNFSDFALCKLQEEVADAINYKVEKHEPGHSWKVTRKAIETETFRIVSMNENVLRCNCLKTVQNGWACQHITATPLFQGLSVYRHILQCQMGSPSVPCCFN